MGKVKTNWLLPGHSGRACRHENLYTKQDKRTGKVYSVQLCNPSDSVSEDQAKQRVSFGMISKAISKWIDDNSDQATDDYVKVMNTFTRQHRYSTLRGMMMAKKYYTVDASGKVTVTNSANTSGGSGGTSGGGNGELG